jgi:hypothetical protein
MSDLTAEAAEAALIAFIDATNDARAAVIEQLGTSARAAADELERGAGDSEEGAATRVPLTAALRSLSARSESTLAGVADLLTNIGGSPVPEKPRRPSKPRKRPVP